MKICLISPLPFFPNSSGATARMVSIVKFLESKGHEVSVVLPYRYQETEKDYLKFCSGKRIRFLRLFSSSIPHLPEETKTNYWGFLKRIRNLLPFNIAFFSPMQLAELFNELKKNKPHLIIAEFDGSWLLGYILKRLLKLPLIIDKHNIESILYCRLLRQKTSGLSFIEKRKVQIVTLMESFVWRNCEGIVVVSKHDLITAQRMFGYKKNVVAAQNGVDLGELSFCNERERTHELLQLPVDCKIMVFHGLGTYGPNIDACQRLMNRILPMTQKLLLNQEVFVVIIGPGMAPKNKIYKRNHIRLVGEVLKPELYEIIRNSDVAVIPLRSGSGTRLKILEYFLLNLPVIATSLAAEGLLLKDGVELLIRNEDEEIAKAIIEIFSNPFLSKRLTESAHELVIERFDWNFVLQPLQELAVRLGTQPLEKC